MNNSLTLVESQGYFSQVLAKIWVYIFIDHIIRIEGSLNEIYEYIINNPAKWVEDEENKNKI